MRVVVPLPGAIDNYIVHQASRSYFGPLLEAGVEIYEYRAGWLHAKTMTVGVQKTKDAGEKVADKAKDLKDRMLGRKTEGPEDHRGATKNQEVMAAQQALKDKGHDPGTIDGKMGPRTRAALSDYQKAEGLKETGRLDDDTRAKLGM